MPPPSDDVTLGEVHRLLVDTRKTLVRIDERLDKLNSERLPARVTALEQTVAWVTRVIVGAVLAAVLGMVIVSGGVV